MKIKEEDKPNNQRQKNTNTITIQQQLINDIFQQYFCDIISSNDLLHYILSEWFNYETIYHLDQLPYQWFGNFQNINEFYQHYQHILYPILFIKNSLAPSSIINYEIQQIVKYSLKYHTENELFEHCFSLIYSQFYILYKSNDKQARSILKLMKEYKTMNQIKKMTHIDKNQIALHIITQYFYQRLEQLSGSLSTKKNFQKKKKISKKKKQEKKKKKKSSSY